MILVKTATEMKNITKKWKNEGFQIGLVPTMGYLHEGHRSLIRKASDENDQRCRKHICESNPIRQNEDLKVTPRDIDHDIAVCKKKQV